MIDPDRTPNPQWVDFHQRNLAVAQSLYPLTVMVLGCGAVGSWVTWLLAQMGVARFVLLDTDDLEPANLCRHVAVEFVGLNKALAVAKTLEARLPVEEVRVITTDLSGADPAAIRGLLRGVDVVVLATGNSSVQYPFLRASLEVGIPTFSPGMMPTGHPLLGDLVMTPAHYRGAACFECLHPAGPEQTEDLPAQEGLAAEVMRLAAETALAIVDTLVPASRGHDWLQEQYHQGRNYLLLARTPPSTALVRTHRQDSCPTCQPGPLPAAPSITRPRLSGPARVRLAATLVALMVLFVGHSILVAMFSFATVLWVRDELPRQAETRAWLARLTSRILDRDAL